MFQPPGDCPVCGGFVPARALACPDCGADKRSGWRNGGSDLDGIDLPDPHGDDFDYEGFLENEFGTGNRSKPRHLSLFWWITGIVLLAAWTLWMLAG